jgi:hypothetical protein
MAALTGLHLQARAVHFPSFCYLEPAAGAQRLWWMAMAQAAARQPAA